MSRVQILQPAPQFSPLGGMVDAADLGSAAARRESSSLLEGTITFAGMAKLVKKINDEQYLCKQNCTTRARPNDDDDKQIHI
tara:strand:- start:118 stop:363 length:246 start_codon:yes stop_codon:yes gene_type:complete